MRKYIIFLAVASLLVIPDLTQAISSTNYQLPNYQDPSGSGSISSISYTLEANTAPILGGAASANYTLDQGFPSVTGGKITLSLSTNSVYLGTLNPGTPINATMEVTITTTSLAGYSLAIEKHQLLTKVGGSVTIPDYLAPINLPTTWDGTGFGFSVVSGTNLDAKWSSGVKYAAMPILASTTFHSLNQAITAPDVTVLRYQVDVPSTQEPGPYRTQVTLVATALP